ncbi:MAG: hypothetical protein V4497_11730 [Bacteroidota bacterium]
MKNFKTKNSIAFFSLVVLLMVVGCKEKPAEKEVIVVPGTNTETTTESKTIIEKQAPVDSTTSITVDKKGLEVDSKKVDVKIGN